MFGKFRVIRGRHAEGGVTYTRGQVVESKCDLLKQNGPGAIKFERLADDVYVPPITIKPEDPQEGEKPFGLDLGSMSKQQLIELAEAEEISLDGATLKAEILEVLRDALDE